ncbi:hypothetical protein XACM_1681 [Xanthomonas euvesicatoria pv. citrumelo F1]|nr:hypothetical protein XACM_1681 [Xanthomonas euvesicatoria pv. citrumelo F1]
MPKPGVQPVVKRLPQVLVTISQIATIIFDLNLFSAFDRYVSQHLNPEDVIRLQGVTIIYGYVNLILQSF